VKYDASSIQILDDPVAIIRRRPKMHVGSEDIRPGWLAAALARDALDLGCKHAEIHRLGDWWIVASEQDRLTYHNKLSTMTSNGSAEGRDGKHE
jgi:hypothetical protein